MNMVLLAKRVNFIVDISEIRGGDETIKLRNKIVDYGAMYEACFMALMDAVKRQDAEAIKLHFDAVVYFEQMQRLAAVQTREHLRKNAMERGHGQA